MNFETQRRLMCQLGHRIWQRGWVAAHNGSFSRRLGEGLFLVTPAGTSLGFLAPDMPVVVDIQGRVVSHIGPYLPAADVELHLSCYRRLSDVGGICCAQPPAAAAFAHTGQELLVPGLGPLDGPPRPVPPVHTPGALEPLEGHHAVLLSGHTVLTMGRDLEQAFWRMEALEHAAQVNINVRLLETVSPAGNPEQKGGFHSYGAKLSD